MLWFLDWDGTMTTTDTLSVVASIGKNRDQKLPPWSHFTEAYVSDYEAHKAKHKPKGKAGTSLSTFLVWKESLSEVERASVERVERADIFAIGLDNTHTGALEISMRSVQVLYSKAGM